MEADWNKLTDAERAEFAAWQEQRRAASAPPTRYADMTDAERREFARKAHLPTRHDPRTNRLEVGR